MEPPLRKMLENPFAPATAFWDPGGCPEGTEIALHPLAMAEIHYDTYDVRSQVKVTGDTLVAYPMISMEDDFLWTPDMFRIVNRAQLQPLPASGVVFHAPDPLPDFRSLVPKIREAFLRHFSIPVLHHRELQLFSHPSESPSDFTARCRTALRERCTGDWMFLQKKLRRDLDGIRERYHLRPVVSDEADSFAHVEEKRKRMITEASEALTRHFITFGSPVEIPPVPDILVLDDLEYALQELLVDAARELGKFYAHFESDLASVETHRIHLKTADITVHQCSVLWVCAKAEE